VVTEPKSLSCSPTFLEIEIETEKENQKVKDATNMVTEFATVGRIKNEEPIIAKWVELAKNDFDGTKELIENLPLNAIANKIEIDETKKEANPNDFMAQALKEINNKNKK
jgi:hypothetical protein